MADVQLTPQQAQAVTNRGGSLLVSAAAGSGKTKVLVERVFSYLTEEHCHIDDFLIITFTRAAAAAPAPPHTPGCAQAARTARMVFQPLAMFAVRAVTICRTALRTKSTTSGDVVVVRTVSNGRRNSCWKL